MNNKTKYDEVINKLKKKYPNGTTFSNLTELKKDNMDIERTLTTMEKSASSLYGKSLPEYLCDEGIFLKSNILRNNNSGRPSSNLNEIIEELKRRYARFAS